MNMMSSINIPDLSKRPAIPLISIIAPFHNERDAVNLFFTQIQAVIAPLHAFRFEIVCINDGSQDGTLDQ